MKKVKSLQKHLKNAKILLSPDYIDNPVHDSPIFARKVKEAEEFLSKYPLEKKSI